MSDVCLFSNVGHYISKLLDVFEILMFQMKDHKKTSQNPWKYNYEFFYGPRGRGVKPTALIF